MLASLSNPSFEAISSEEDSRRAWRSRELCLRKESVLKRCDIGGHRDSRVVSHSTLNIGLLHHGHLGEDDTETSVRPEHKIYALL